MNEARARRQGEYSTEPKQRGPGRPKKVIPDYPPGVSVGELSPLFDFSRKPWLMLAGALRQLTVAWTVQYHTETNAAWKRKGRELKILDAACGYGELYTLLRDARRAPGTVYNYIGIDLDQEKLAVARLLRKNIDVREMDVRGVLAGMLPERPFDVIVSSETLEHVQREEGIQLVNDFYSLLKDGGLLVMTVPTPLNSLRAKRPFHMYEWEEKELLDLVRNVGFKVIDYYQLFVPEKYWEIDVQKRLPQEVIRPAASAMLVAPPEGSVTMVVAEKERDERRPAHV